MRVTVGLLGVSHPAQCLNHVGLRVALARVDHVIDCLRSAKMRMWFITLFRGNPALMIRITEERFIAEVLAQQSELP